MERLFRWSASVGAPTGPVLTLSFHRADTAPPGIELEAVGAGRHAVYRLAGSHEGIAAAYRRLFEEWLPTSGEVAAQRPCMELYRTMPREVPAGRLITDLCVPLQEPPPR